MVFLLESLFFLHYSTRARACQEKHGRKDENIKGRKPFYKSASAAESRNEKPYTSAA